MITVTVGDLKARFSEILKKVQEGESIAVAFGRKKEILAYLVPKKMFGKRSPRPLGLLEGKASYSIKDDFEISEQEFVSL